ncbi:MAG: flagellar brake protein [Rhizobacter sp.]|nr:flagellar brake protein [Rhizobacter sp.]
MDSPAEILSVLKSLQGGNVLVNLNGSDGAAYTTTLWAVDPDRGMLSFSADEHSSQVQQLVEAEEAVAVAYLDSIKLQFDVSGLLLVHGGKTCALSCALPRVLYRFQRRAGYRVRPILRNTPVAKVRHPMIPDMALSLRVLDVSIGGCALFLPDDVPPLQPGVVLNGVQIELGLDTRLTTSLRLQHVTSLNQEAKGVRLGCEIVDPSADTLRSLQRYINQTQQCTRARRLSYFWSREARAFAAG